MNYPVSYQFIKNKLLRWYVCMPYQAATHVTLLIVVSALLFLIRAGSLPLMDPDESRCAVIAADMQRFGDWIVPHLDGEVYYDKPAPFFWLTIAAMKLTDNVELSGRLVAAIGGIAVVIITYFFARQLFNAAAGLIAGLILATSAEFLFVARWFRMDMPFTAGIWAAIWWFWRSESLFETDGGKSHRRRGWLGFYFFCGIATLFKGPVGIVLPVLIILSWLILSRRYRQIIKFFYLPGITLYLLIAAPWYVAISLREPNYVYEFFIHHNLERYAGNSLGHHWPGILYIVILLGGLLPWTVYFPAAIEKYFPRRWRTRADSPLILLLWLSAIVTILFFSFSRTKMAGYIVPAFPPLAVLMGGLIGEWISADAMNKAMKNAGKGFVVTLSIMLAFLIGLEIYLKSIDLWIFIPAAIIIFSVWQMIKYLRTDHQTRFIIWMFAGITTLYLLAFGHTAIDIYEMRSTRALARLIPPGQASYSKICFFTSVQPSFIFYTDTAELERFSETSPESIKQLADLMVSPQRVYCLVSGQKKLDTLKKINGCTIYIIGKNAERWLVTNHPPANHTLCK